MTGSTARQRPATGRRGQGGTVAEPLVRPPQQERSRQSFQRALDAAVALLNERGSNAFTLAEVAERADVSIGSIYGRVKSKDDLLRSAQVRELERIDAELTSAFNKLSGKATDLHEEATLAITAVAVELRRNADVLGAFMVLGNTDPMIAAAGGRSHRVLVQHFTTALLSMSKEIKHPDPVAAVEWTFTVVYSVVARYLGLGSSRESSGQGSWNHMLANLSDMTASFLTNPPVKKRQVR